MALQLLSYGDIRSPSFKLNVSNEFDREVILGKQQASYVSYEFKVITRSINMK